MSPNIGFISDTGASYMTGFHDTRQFAWNQPVCVKLSLFLSDVVGFRTSFIFIREKLLPLVAKRFKVVFGDKPFKEFKIIRLMKTFVIFLATFTFTKSTSNLTHKDYPNFHLNKWKASVLSYLGWWNFWKLYIQFQMRIYIFFQDMNIWRDYSPSF